MTNTRNPLTERGLTAEAITHYEVSDEGTLRLAGFADPETRADYFPDLADDWEASPQALADAVAECPPLAWEVHGIYEEVREGLEGELELAQKEEHRDRSKIAALKTRLKSMPEDPERGVQAWLLGVDGVFFEDEIVGRVRHWFLQPPNWGWDDDYLPDGVTAQGAALAYFRDLDRRSLAMLGVEVVEGEHPGSTYYAAELKCGIDEANAAACALGLPIRFCAPEARVVT